MLFFFYQHDQVSVHTTATCRISFTTQRQLHPFTHSCRNIDRNHLFRHQHALPITESTFFIDNLSFALASRTRGSGLHRSQYRILYPGHLSRSFTGRTSGIGFSILCSRSITMLTSHVFLYLDFLLNSGSNFLKVHFHLHSQVRSPVYPAGTTATTKTSETTKATETSENIPELRENIIHTHAATKTSLSGSTYSGVTELIITTSLLFVTQHIVCFSGFFKFFLGLLVARIFIRVILQSQFSICFLDLSGISTFRYPQHLIIISLFHYHATIYYSPTTTFAKRITLSFK